jgi:hypothetical protein
MATLAKAYSAKIESHDRQPESVNRFRSLVDHFVVHRATKQRVRMADHSGQWRLVGPRFRVDGPKNRFNAACTTIQHKGSMKWSWHTAFYVITEKGKTTNRLLSES